MKRQPENSESGLNNLSDEHLKTVENDAKYSLVESEIRLLRSKFNLAIAEDELQFRKSGKPKRPAADWHRQWFQDVTDIATARGLDLNVAWQIAKRALPNAT